MASQSTKQKKVKGVRQKLKLFRASEPLKSVLMWGVNYSMTQLNHIRPRAMLLSDDFKAYLKVKVNNHLFNKEVMPSRFKFKEYCPLVFKYLRERFGISDTLYLDSFIKRQPVWDSAQGRSGSKFLLTHNRFFVVKTISSEEVEQMHHMLQSYHEYIVNCHCQTLLPQYLGMYRLTVNDQETYFLVMRNVLSPRLRIHKKFDLKGSTVDREASEKEKSKQLPCYKDVDFVNEGYKIFIGEEGKQRIMKILENDVEFLQANNLMDYSLLVGIHDPVQAAADEAQGNQHDYSTDDGLSPCEDDEMVLSTGESAAGGRTDSGDERDLTGEESGPEAQSTGAAQLQSLTTPPDSPLGPTEANTTGTGATAGTSCAGDVSDVISAFSGDLDSIFEYYGVKSCNTEREEIYFMAIIDILTRYGMRKRTAQTYKTVKHGVGAEISTVKPELYARRFIDFIGQALE